MSSHLRLTALAIALVLSSSAGAAEAAPGAQESGATNGEYGLAFGIRSGYAIPLGNSVSSANLSDTIKGMAPIWVDAGFRFSPYVYLGAFFQYGFGILPSSPSCSGNSSCSESVVRLGANLHYHFVPNSFADPWLGVGFGYEWLNLKATGPLGTLEGSLKGWEFVNIQFGVDLRPSPFVSIGPFIALTISQYDHGDVTVGSFHTSGEISDKSVHEWLMFGLRGQFNINFN